MTAFTIVLWAFGVEPRMRRVGPDDDAADPWWAPSCRSHLTGISSGSWWICWRCHDGFADEKSGLAARVSYYICRSPASYSGIRPRPCYSHGALPRPPFDDRPYRHAIVWALVEVARLQAAQQSFALIMLTTIDLCAGLGLLYGSLGAPKLSRRYSS